MKTLLKITLLTTGVFALAASAATAQDNAPAPTAAQHPRRDAIFARRAAIRHHLAKQLALTDAQKTQLKSERTAAAGLVKAIRADASLTPDQKKAKIRETLTAARTQMRGVLTPEQQAKLQAMRTRKHHRPQNG
jgi:Spy/CpxP family protein refolding chaperone